MQSTLHSRDQVGWRFWLQWTIVNTIGWGAGLAFGFAMVSRYGQAIGRALSPSADSGLALVGAMVGTMTVPVGILQWIVLRRHYDLAGRWVLASTIGWVIGLALGWSVSMAMSESTGDPVRSAVTGALIGGIGGGVSGMMQWFVTRDQGNQIPQTLPQTTRHTARDLGAGWWLLASVVGWGVAFAAAWSTAWFMGRLSDWIATYAMIGVIVGGVGGAFTGIALVWLLRRPVQLVPQ